MFNESCVEITIIYLAMTSKIPYRCIRSNYVYVRIGLGKVLFDQIRHLGQRIKMPRESDFVFHLVHL